MFKLLSLIIFISLSGCETLRDVNQSMRSNAIEFKKSETTKAVNNLSLYQMGKITPDKVNIKSDVWEKNINKWTAEIPSLVGPTLWECSSVHDPKTGQLVNVVSCILSQCYPNCN